MRALKAGCDSMSEDFNPTAVPSGDGCLECLANGGWWLDLRRCAACGHIGRCDSSPCQHATAHFHETGHPIVQPFEPGEGWFWDYRLQDVVDGPDLAPPASRPSLQPTPGPAGAVPGDWPQRLHTEV